MRRFLMAAAVACGLCLTAYSVRADDDAEKAADSSKQVKGVLIDTTCGAKQLGQDDPEKAAAGHKAACALKCGADGGYAVISGKKLIKLDDKGNEKATAYLKKDNADTKVVVMGKLSEDGKTINVTDIKSAKDAKKSS
jgi:hypothetical protein